MGIAPLLLGAHHGQHVAGPVHGVVRRGRDVGPVRLDVGEVQAPWVVTDLGHELHGAPRHVGCLGVLLLHARGLAGVPHGPARGQCIAVALRSVGPIVPGVVAAIALVVEVAVVARHLRVVAAVGALRVQPIVALEGVEAALGNAHADDGVGIDAEPGHALGVGAHVRLADQRRAYAQRPQVVTQRHLADLERHRVPHRAVRLHVAPRVEAHARRPAHRRLHIGPREAHTPRRQPVDVGRLELGMPRARQIVPPELVAHDEQDVARGSHGHALYYSG